MPKESFHNSVSDSITSKGIVETIRITKIAFEILAKDSELYENNDYRKRINKDLEAFDALLWSLRNP